MTSSHWVLYPHVEQTPEEHTFAPRLASLAGTTVALVDINKPQGDVFLEEVGSILRRDFGVRATPMLTKSSAGRHLTEEQLESVRAEAEAVIIGVAD